MSIKELVLGGFKELGKKFVDHRPEIFMSLGIASILGGVVYSVKDTLDYDEILS